VARLKSESFCRIRSVFILGIFRKQSLLLLGSAAEELNVSVFSVSHSVIFEM
jgi:hypothetical protein